MNAKHVAIGLFGNTHNAEIKWREETERPSGVNKMNATILNALLYAELKDEPFPCKPRAERLTLKDGESLSVQASKYHYCTPREDRGPYMAVEVGFPSVEPPETWREYFDGDWENQDRTGSVYGYVPIDLVIDFINAHGGV